MRILIWHTAGRSGGKSQVLFQQCSPFLVNSFSLRTAWKTPWSCGVLPSEWSQLQLRLMQASCLRLNVRLMQCKCPSFCGRGVLSWSSLGDGRGEDDLGGKLSSGVAELDTAMSCPCCHPQEKACYHYLLSLLSWEFILLLIPESRNSDSLST